MKCWFVQRVSDGKFLCKNGDFRSMEGKPKVFLRENQANSSISNIMKYETEEFRLVEARIQIPTSG